MAKLDQETNKLITEIAGTYCHRTFGYFDEEDIQSEIWIICLQALEEYNNSIGPLKNFLIRTVKNRLVNKFKGVTKALRSPCLRCEHYRPEKTIDCAAFGVDKHECSRWKNYTLSIESRNSLINTSEDLKERYDDVPAELKLEAQEAIEYIRKSIDPSMLKEFNRMVAGEIINNSKSEKIVEEVKRLLREQE